MTATALSSRASSIRRPARTSEKLARLRDGASARTVDLFSGCGGLSLGFSLAGCVPVAFSEIDEAAATTYRDNIVAGRPCVAMGDAAETDRMRAVVHSQQGVDLIIGGPPCPAFTRVGRAKLREVNQDDFAFLHDPRAGLYLEYLRHVERLMPIALVLENVPDMLNYGGVNVGEVICARLEELDYTPRYSILNAANYGVPQFRERCFLIAIHNSAGLVPDFPEPSHRAAIPRGYDSARDVALKLVRQAATPTHHVAVRTPDPSSPRAVTAEEALGDLPSFRGAEQKRNAKLMQSHPYKAGVVPGPYASAMREWFPHAAQAVTGHQTRALQTRDFRLFERMEGGDEYPQAYKLATAAFARWERDHPQYKSRTAAYQEKLSSTVPPYDPSKFPNKWWKLKASEPVRTLTAHLGKDTYSHIHYESSQARTITVREAARLQSFPDGFKFSCGLNAAFRQIGNSVPPLLASAIAANLMKSLRGQ